MDISGSRLSHPYSSGYNSENVLVRHRFDDVSGESVANTESSHSVGKEYARAYEGNNYTLNVASEDQAIIIDEVLGRLNESQQKQLIDSGLLDNEKFLDLAAELDDESLGQLANIIGMLGNDAPVNKVGSDTTGYAEQLLDILSEEDDSKRTRILNYAEKLTENVPPGSLDQVDITYSSRGLFNEPDKSKDPLKDFITVLGESNQIHIMMNKLEEFGDEQQPKLLSIMALDNELGNQLMGQLADKSKQTQSHLLDYLGRIASESTSLEYGNPQSALSKKNTAEVGEDIKYSDVAKESIRDVVQLMTDYEFTDEQLLEMGKDLTFIAENHSSEKDREGTISQESTPGDTLNHDSGHTEGIPGSIRSNIISVESSAGNNRFNSLTDTLNDAINNQSADAGPLDREFEKDRLEFLTAEKQNDQVIIAEQRAYIEITKVGLEHLIEKQGAGKVSSEKVTEALETISETRASSSIRQDVFMARYGERTEYDPMRFFTKHNWKADEDMKETILYFMKKNNR